MIQAPEAVNQSMWECCTASNSLEQCAPKPGNAVQNWSTRSAPAIGCGAALAHLQRHNPSCSSIMCCWESSQAWRWSMTRSIARMTSRQPAARVQCMGLVRLHGL